MPNDILCDLTQHGFSQEEASQLIVHGQELELPTRHILNHQGELSSHIYFIMEGLCHASYLTEKGKEFSKEFYWEKDWMISVEGVIKDQPTPYLLETLTACHLLCIPITTLQQWRTEKCSIYLKLLETHLVHKENKQRFMRLYSPEERYQLFCHYHSDVAARISDELIAECLGITPVSLSQIKTYLTKERK